MAEKRSLKQGLLALIDWGDKTEVAVVNISFDDTDILTVTIEAWNPKDSPMLQESDMKELMELLGAKEYTLSIENNSILFTVNLDRNHKKDYYEEFKIREVV